MRGYGAGKRLARAVCHELERLGLEARTDSVESRSWTSITFAGERHALSLEIEGTGASGSIDAWLAGLEEREIDLPGHLLVDIAVVSDERSGDGSRVALRLDAITVESN